MQLYCTLIYALSYLHNNKIICQVEYITYRISHYTTLLYLDSPKKCTTSEHITSFHSFSKLKKEGEKMGVTWQSNSSVLALLGGILIGGVAVTRLALVGKITGISGILNGSSIYKLDKVPYEERVAKILFVLGISFGGLGCYYLFPQAFLDWSTVPIERIIVGGFLVGFSV